MTSFSGASSLRPNRVGGITWGVVDEVTLGPTPSVPKPHTRTSRSSTTQNKTSFRRLNTQVIIQTNRYRLRAQVVKKQKIFKHFIFENSRNVTENLQYNLASIHVVGTYKMLLFESATSTCLKTKTNFSGVHMSQNICCKGTLPITKPIYSILIL